MILFSFALVCFLAKLKIFFGNSNYFPGSWDGWEVDVGGGQWVEDASLVTACHVGDEAATTNYPPISTTSDQV